MGRIVATEYVSLDGVVEEPGGFEDFRHADSKTTATGASLLTYRPIGKAESGSSATEE